MRPDRGKAGKSAVLVVVALPDVVVVSVWPAVLRRCDSCFSSFTQVRFLFFYSTAGKLRNSRFRFLFWLTCGVCGLLVIGGNRICACFSNGVSLTDGPI